MQTLWCVLRKDTTGVDTARVRRSLKTIKHGSRISRKPRGCGYSSKLVGIMGSGVDIVVLGVDISVLVVNGLGLSVDISVLVSNAPVLNVDIRIWVSSA